MGPPRYDLSKACAITGGIGALLINASSVMVSVRIPSACGEMPRLINRAAAPGFRAAHRVAGVIATRLRGSEALERITRDSASRVRIVRRARGAVVGIQRNVIGRKQPRTVSAVDECRRVCVSVLLSSQDTIWRRVRC